METKMNKKCPIHDLELDYYEPDGRFDDPELPNFSYFYCPLDECQFTIKKENRNENFLQNL